ncbi:metal-dependent hydrolase [Vibrio sonorensis]|uniref:metal-dependent hydrolase n=1 Tax=Vibrio sonorensis TaxID=1004316 RepID=UPI0008D90825|nr:metal-dependent hydrolase [Vibrio sonorensis]
MSVSPTRVRFCHQTWQLSSAVQLVHSEGDVTYLVTQSTPFHPVSHIWPDHPADRGIVEFNKQTFTVDDCLVGAIEVSSGQLYVDKNIPVKRDTDGWVFVVVHCLKQPCDIAVGDMVELLVDKEYQNALSRGHSAGHLAFLALNKVLTEQNYWRKDADRKDPLGHYDFNSYAQVTSFVTENRCHDVYRLGKTLRKRGLNSADMLANLEDITQAVNQQLIDWLAVGSAVEVRCEGEALTDSRYWRCQLDLNTLIEIPCGGTHVQSLSDMGLVKVRLQEVDTQHIEMHTDVNER